MGLHRPIACLNTIIHQDLILADNICGDLDFEEGGSPVAMNRILAFRDPVLCDSFAAEIMGYEPYDIEYIRLAEELGVGSADTEGPDSCPEPGGGDCETGGAERAGGKTGCLCESKRRLFCLLRFFDLCLKPPG